MSYKIVVAGIKEEEEEGNASRQREGKPSSTSSSSSVPSVFCLSHVSHSLTLSQLLWSHSHSPFLQRKSTLTLPHKPKCSAGQWTLRLHPLRARKTLCCAQIKQMCNDDGDGADSDDGGDNSWTKAGSTADVKSYREWRGRRGGSCRRTRSRPRLQPGGQRRHQRLC